MNNESSELDNIGDYNLDATINNIPNNESAELHKSYLTAKSSVKWNEAKQRYYYKPWNMRKDIIINIRKR